MTRPALAIALLLVLSYCSTGASMDIGPIPLDLLGGVPSATDVDMTAVDEAAESLERAFTGAAAAYERREYPAAADAFMNAARAARGFDALAGQRSTCYRNAAKAWSMAGALAANRPLLDAAAVEDPRSADEIRAILAILLDLDGD
jgi:hypothetical protein